jgi:hypothetical protein
MDTTITRSIQTILMTVLTPVVCSLMPALNEPPYHLLIDP